MRYYVGPFERDHMDAWERPAGCVGCVDLRSIPAHATAGSALFVMPDDARLPDGFDLLGQGNAEDVAPNAAARAAWTRAAGIAPRGTSLADWVEYTLTEAADPTGETRAKPLVPTSRRLLDLWIGPTRRRRRFDLRAPHAAPVLDMLRREYAQRRQDARDGKIIGPAGVDAENHRRWLDVLATKYGVSDPEDVFIPRGLPRESRLPHATTFTDSFTGGFGLTYTQNAGSWSVSSNELTCNMTSTDARIRADHDLTGNDNYAEIEKLAAATGSFLGHGAIARYSGDTGYLGWHYQNSNTTFVSKIVAGTRTNLAGPNAYVPSYPITIRAIADGSNISMTIEGGTEASVSDVAISTGTRGGVFASFSHTSCRLDDFVMADLGAAPASSPIFLHTLMGVG